MIFQRPLYQDPLDLMESFLKRQSKTQVELALAGAMASKGQPALESPTLALPLMFTGHHDDGSLDFAKIERSEQIVERTEFHGFYCGTGISIFGHQGHEAIGIGAVKNTNQLEAVRVKADEGRVERCAAGRQEWVLLGADNLIAVSPLLESAMEFYFFVVVMEDLHGREPASGKCSIIAQIAMRSADFVP